MPRKARSGGVELNVGMIEKRKEPRKNISDDEIIWFVLLFPLSITLLVWSMYGEGPELSVLVENALLKRMRDSQASTTSI
jgi:hypothetical protein